MTSRHTEDDIMNLVFVPVTLAPANQASTNTFAAVVGSDLDTLFKKSVAYTIKNVGANSIDWRVVGANISDFTDAVIVQAAAAVVASAFSSYTVAQAPFRYYRVEVKATVADSQGSAQVRAIAKG